MATLALPPRPGRPWLVGVICAALLAALLSPLAFFSFIPWLSLLAALPVIPIIGIVWGRFAEQRALVARLEDALDLALKRLRRADDTETAYFAIKDALEGHPGVAGAALFVKESKANKAGLSPAITSGALLGLRALAKVTDFEHLCFLLQGNELLYRPELKQNLEHGQGTSTDKPLLALLEEAGVDLVWVLTSDDGPVAAIVMRESVGVSLGAAGLRDNFAKRSASFGRALWTVLPQAFEATKTPPPPENRPTPAPSENRPASTKSVAPEDPRTPVEETAREREAAPKASTNKNDPTPSEPEGDLRLPFSLLPDPIGLIASLAPLSQALSQAREILQRQRVLRLVGPKGSVKDALAFALAMEQHGVIDWHAAPAESDPEDPDADLLVWDESRSGAFQERPRQARCIVLASQGDGLLVPLLSELGPSVVAEVLAEQIAAKKVELAKDARDWLGSFSFAADLEELLLLVAKALLLHGEDAALSAAALGAVKELEAPISVPVEEPEPMQDELRDAALKDALSDSEGQEFHEAVLVFKRALVRKALESSKNNRAKAARLLGLQRTYLYRLIRQLGLEEEPQKAFDEPLSPR